MLCNERNDCGEKSLRCSDSPSLLLERSLPSEADPAQPQIIQINTEFSKKEICLGCAKQKYDGIFYTSTITGK